VLAGRDVGVAFDLETHGEAEDVVAVGGPAVLGVERPTAERPAPGRR
jgi:hypothetical protein